MDASSNPPSPIRPLRSAGIAAAWGFVIGLIAYTNLEAHGLALALAMLVNALAWSAAAFCLVLLVQSFRRRRT